MLACTHARHAVQKAAQYDARGIFLAYTCPACHTRKMAEYREDVLTDATYWHDEPIDED